MIRKLLLTVILLATVVLGVTFAAQNPQEISLSYYFNLNWHGPLVTALLGAVVVGFVLAAVPLWIRLLRLRRKCRYASSPEKGSRQTVK